MKRTMSAVLVLAVVLSIAACSRGISREQYISTMAALGCRGTGEGTPDAEAIFKENKVTYKDIQDFRKNGKPDEMLKVSMEIATRVMACHGVKATNQ